MSYAGERLCWDADSHLMPAPDFLSRHADPEFREQMWIGGGKNGGAAFEKQFDKVMDSVRRRLSDPEKTAKLEESVIAGAKGWYAHGAVDAAERSRTLDLLGFAGQLVFSTFAGRYRFAADSGVMYAGARAHARAMAEFCARDERLFAVTMIPLDDPQRAAVEHGVEYLAKGPLRNQRNGGYHWALKDGQPTSSKIYTYGLAQCLLAAS